MEDEMKEKILDKYPTFFTIEKRKKYWSKWKMVYAK